MMYVLRGKQILLRTILNITHKKNYYPREVVPLTPCSFGITKLILIPLIAILLISGPAPLGDGNIKDRRSSAGSGRDREQG